jgi:hypothetical protein
VVVGSARACGVALFSLSPPSPLPLLPLTVRSSVTTVNGRLDRSTRVTVSEKMRVPNFADCALRNDGLGRGARIGGARVGVHALRASDGQEGGPRRRRARPRPAPADWFEPARARGRPRPGASARRSRQKGAREQEPPPWPPPLSHRNLSHSSPPMIPSGKPGKFSTSVVVVSCPPAAMPLAIQPSRRMGASSARAAYTAAVCAAGPEPTMHTGVRIGSLVAVAEHMVVRWRARAGRARRDAAMHRWGGVEGRVGASALLRWEAVRRPERRG